MKRARSFDELLHEFIKPTLITLIASNFFTSLVGVIILMIHTGLSYSDWPLPIRLSIELISFIGVSLTAEVLFFNSIKSCETVKQGINAIIEEDPPKYSKDAAKALEQSAAYQKQKAQRIEQADKELKTERRARLAFGFLGAVYFINFIVQTTLHFSADQENALIVSLSILRVFAATYALWYYAARYTEHRENLVTRVRGLVEDAVLAKADSMRDHFKTGQQSEEDLNFAEQSLGKRDPGRPLIGALRKPLQGAGILKTADMFDLLGIDDPSSQRVVRNALARMLAAHVPGVQSVKNGGRSEWHVSREAYATMLCEPAYLGNRKLVEGVWISKTRQRPKRSIATKNNGSDAEAIRSLSGATSDPATTQDTLIGNTETIAAE